MWFERISLIFWNRDCFALELFTGVQVWNDDFFPQKKHIKFGRMIKRDLFKICSIASYTFFPSFGQFVDTTPVKIFPFCQEPFIFSHLRKKVLLSKCVTHRCKQVVIGRSQIWSKPHGVDLPSCASTVSRTGFAVYRTLSWRKMTLCCLFWYSGRFLSSDGSNRSIVVDSVWY